jgi:predicted polyphosphate/ATP-dependent NAD kinase
VTRAIGLLINPVAGVGGPAGMKGSDGADVQTAALSRGARARAGERAQAALAVIASAHPQVEIITAGGTMGADAVRAVGLSARVVYQPETPSTGADTAAATQALLDAGADLVLFVGGDGTARDVTSVLRPGQPMLGVPAGVKMYSGCFAVSPSAAGALAARWLSDQRLPLQQREVLDVDEEQIRYGRVDPRLFAMVPVPYIAGRTQSRKNATPVSEAAAVRIAAAGAIAEMKPGSLYLLGPGSTMMELARQLRVPKTPLGVDVVRIAVAPKTAAVDPDVTAGSRTGSLVVADASEKQLLEVIADAPRTRSAPALANVKAVITVIGGQGFLLGRGNQQISAAVLDTLGPDPLIVVATEEKLTSLAGRPLLVDTGNAVVDHRLTGYIRVITGAQSAGIYPVTATN